MYIYIYTYTHTYIYIYIHIHTYIYVYRYIDRCRYLSIYSYLRRREPAALVKCSCAVSHACEGQDICTYIYIYIYI